MSSPIDAENDFRTADTLEAQRAAALAWLDAIIVDREKTGLRQYAGRFLASALRDLERGYAPPLLRAVESGEPRGKTHGGKANARARVALAAVIGEEWGWTTALANRVAAFRSGMTVKAVSRLRENIKDGNSVEVATLLQTERDKWEANLAAPDCPHQFLLHLALTEIGYDRPFHST